MYFGCFSDAIFEAIVRFLYGKLFILLLVHSLQNLVCKTEYSAANDVEIELIFFSLPFNITNTSFDFAFGLFGVELGGWDAVLFSELYLSYYFTFMFFVSTVMQDIIMTFKALDEDLSIEFTNEMLGKYFRQIMNIHYWIIKLNEIRKMQFAPNFSSFYLFLFRFRERIVNHCSKYIFLSIICFAIVECAILFQFQVVSYSIFAFYLIFYFHFINFRSKSAQSLTIQLYQATGIGVISVVCLFILCYYGQLLTTECLKVSAVAYDSKWYRYPIRYRLIVLMIIQYTQEPYFVWIFGLINCSMESFASVNSILGFYFNFFNNFFYFRS